jgi:hypothetical protein
MDPETRQMMQIVSDTLALLADLAERVEHLESALAPQMQGPLRSRKASSVRDLRSNTRIESECASKVKPQGFLARPPVHSMKSGVLTLSRRQKTAGPRGLSAISPRALHFQRQ